MDAAAAPRATSEPHTLHVEMCPVLAQITPSCLYKVPSSYRWSIATQTCTLIYISLHGESSTPLPHTYFETPPRHIGPAPPSAHERTALLLQSSEVVCLARRCSLLGDQRGPPASHSRRLGSGTGSVGSVS
ncbi:hypothetical protein JB92DRAFT_2935729 [Gautieria morchelliformis]|nr:hypothetical protein JB92DRAFT_2935729 [Gautieria morchelliformis]